VTKESDLIPAYSNMYLDLDETEEYFEFVEEVACQVVDDVYLSQSHIVGRFANVLRKLYYGAVREINIE